MTTQITNHADLAVEQLIEQFKNKPRFEAFIRVLGKYCQQVEDMLWDVYFSRIIDHAGCYGPHLDMLGKIVGETRNYITTEDADFKIIIKAKIRVLLSRGTADDLIRICMLILGATPFQYSEQYPATVQIDILGVPARPLVPQLLLRMLQKAKAGGVRINVAASDPTAFQYDSVNNSSPNLTLGFGSTVSGGGALYSGLIS
jgi:hypothetical protein